MPLLPAETSLRWDHLTCAQGALSPCVWPLTSQLLAPLALPSSTTVTCNRRSHVPLPARPESLMAPAASPPMTSVVTGYEKIANSASVTYLAPLSGSQRLFQFRTRVSQLPPASWKSSPADFVAASSAACLRANATLSFICAGPGPVEPDIVGHLPTRNAPTNVPPPTSRCN